MNSTGASKISPTKYLTQVGLRGSSCICDGGNSGRDTIVQQGMVVPTMRDAMIMAAAVAAGSACSCMICVAPSRGTTPWICHNCVDESSNVMYIVPGDPTSSTCNGRLVAVVKADQVKL